MGIGGAKGHADVQYNPIDSLDSRFLLYHTQRVNLVQFVGDVLCGEADSPFFNGGTLSGLCSSMSLDIFPYLTLMVRTEDERFVSQLEENQSSVNAAAVGRGGNWLLTAALHSSSSRHSRSRSSRRREAQRFPHLHNSAFIDDAILSQLRALTINSWTAKELVV